MTLKYAARSCELPMRIDLARALVLCGAALSPLFFRPRERGLPDGRGWEGDMSEAEAGWVRSLFGAN